MRRQPDHVRYTTWPQFVVANNPHYDATELDRDIHELGSLLKAADQRMTALGYPSTNEESTAGSAWNAA
jgi:hypothetical protein